MRKSHNHINNFKRLVSIFVIAWISFLNPVVAFAEETAVDAVGNPTGAPADTGAPECTGAGCGQGADQGTDQGTNQGTDQGGSSAVDLGADENGELPAGVVDTRQGANQGTAQGTAQGSGTGLSGANSNTGSGSDNTADISSSDSSSTGVNNTVNDTSSVGAAANTGNNTQNSNTQADGLKTGNASIGVTQVKNDNTATIGGTSGLDVSGYNGDYAGDLVLGFSAALGQLTGSGSSVRAVNDTTGSESNNSVNINTRREEVNEVQNDGLIDNLLDLSAITGQNEANKNTSDGSITTGDANIAATLVNLLNSTIINGSLWLTVADIFGDLNGNIILPDLGALAAAAGYGNLAIDAANEQTGADSNNTIDIDVTAEEETAINNDADIKTNIDAQAITGQNETLANTGGGSIATGDGSVSASSISLANTTIEGGNWGLVIVNALNRWLGFMVGEAGEVRALSQDETIREIEARNSATGADSDNNIAISDSTNRQTDVYNNATINNDVKAAAITGQNQANKNTGQGIINTGDANIEATAVNIANTTVKDGSLFIAIVNIFGDWFGDLLYNDSSLAGAAGAGAAVDVNASNANTGAESTNEIDVNVSREQTTNIDNEANIDTILTADIDTGNNKANRNTNGSEIKTGDGILALNSRAVANLTGLLINPALGLTVSGLNDTTGFDSENKIRARLNDERVVDINNEANISTIFAALANTGDNEANANTVGGRIATGNILADVGINNLINQVILVLAGQGFDTSALSGAIAGGPIINADLANKQTGAESTNTNDVEALRNLLAEVANQGMIANLIDLLFNTGRNKANENTLGGGEIYSGAGCLDGDIANNANGFAVDGISGLSLTMQNLADIDNVFNVLATTGSNQANENTQGSAGRPGGATGRCPQLAIVPEPSVNPNPQPPEEQPEAVPAAEEPGESSQGGGGDEGSEEPKVKVAGITDGQAPKGGGKSANGNGLSLLKRFPVAGDVGQAIWLAGRSGFSPWPLFLASSVVLLGVAWHWDRRVKYNKFLVGIIAANIS